MLNWLLNGDDDTDYDAVSVRRDYTTLILVLLITIIGSFFLSKSGLIILCLGSYIGISFAQRHESNIL